MNRIILLIIFGLLYVSCNIIDNEPDYIAFSNVQEIQLTGLNDKEGIEFNVGYWNTQEYNTNQKKKTYISDTVDYFSPGIDITSISYEKYYNPPKYRYSSSFINNVLIIDISYFNEENN